MIDEKKLIESINNQIKWMNNEAKTKSDEDVMTGLKVVLALVDEQEKIGEWIPCSERLPEEESAYLCTLFRHEDGYKWVEELIYYSKSDTWLFGAEPYSYDLDKSKITVLAWSPIPEPYKEE